MKVAYFGDEFSHTYACAEEANPGASFIGFATIRAALSAVVSGECDRAVVPLENSVEGTVNESVDSIAEKGLFIVSEHLRPIHQNLIAFALAQKKDVRVVYSHPQALSQCRRYLERELPLARIEPVAYTSLGIEKITDKGTAAIARAAKEGTRILESHIEDSESNVTRFVAVSRESGENGNKASVVFGTPNRPGELLGALTLLKERGLNMTRIESRPDKEVFGAYVFYVDFLFDGKKSTLCEFLSALGKKTGRLKFLGVYTAANQQ